MLKLKVVVDGEDKKKESIFFEADKLNVIDADSKLIIQKWVENRRITMAVFNHWRYYEAIDKNSQTTNDPLRVTWKALLKSMSEELTDKLKNSIIGSEIIDIDVQGTRIVLRTDAKPVRYGNVIYDTSRIIVKS